MPRVAAVSFLNTVPLVWGMTNGPQRGLFDLDFCTPAECADRLEHGHAEIGIVPVIEAARNLACVGGVPAAVTDCLNYGNPEQPEGFWEFEEGVRGIGDACRGVGRLEAPEEPLPVVSGNVSSSMVLMTSTKGTAAMIPANISGS